MYPCKFSSKILWYTAGHYTMSIHTSLGHPTTLQPHWLIASSCSYRRLVTVDHYLLRTSLHYNMEIKFSSRTALPGQIVASPGQREDKPRSSPAFSLYPPSLIATSCGSYVSNYLPYDVSTNWIFQ